MPFTALQVLGLCDSHLTQLYPNHSVHKDAAKAVFALQKSAKAAGFDLRLASAYRSFDRQLSIWCEKANGQRAVLDVNSQPIDISQLSADKLINAICTFTAIPGASRHHWGSDIDIYDANGFDANNRPQLISSEYSGQGPSAAMFNWLLKNAEDLGFAFPYLEHKKNGIAVEPWHLSYLPVARKAQQVLTLNCFKTHLAQQKFALCDRLLQDADTLYKNLVEQYYV